MISEDKFLRIPITEKALNVLLDKHGSREKLNNFVADYAYADVGMKRPQPPTPEQRKALEEIAQAEKLVNDGFMTADKLKEFKLQKVKEHGIDPALVGLSEDTDKATSDKPANNNTQRQKPAQTKPATTQQPKR